MLLVAIQSLFFTSEIPTDVKQPVSVEVDKLEQFEKLKINFVRFDLLQDQLSNRGQKVEKDGKTVLRATLERELSRDCVQKPCRFDELLAILIQFLAQFRRNGAARPNDLVQAGSYLVHSGPVVASHFADSKPILSKVARVDFFLPGSRVVHGEEVPSSKQTNEFSVKMPGEICREGKRMI